MSNRDIEEERTMSRSLTSSMLGSMRQSIYDKGSKVKLEIQGVKFIGEDQYKHQESCHICFQSWTKTFRKHHCRVCASSVCGTCSASTVNKQRCCDVCIYKLSNVQQDTKKDSLLFELQGAAKMILQVKSSLEKQISRLKQEANDTESIERDIKNLEDKISKAQSQIEQMRKTQQQIQKQIASITS